MSRPNDEGGPSDRYTHEDPEPKPEGYESGTATLADYIHWVRVALKRLWVRGHTLDSRNARRGLESLNVIELELKKLAESQGRSLDEELPSVNWHRAQELVAAVDVIAFARPGIGFDGPQKAFSDAFPEGRLTTLELPPIAVSSTGIRDRIAAGDRAPDLLDPTVADYIFERGLYGAQNGVDPG